VTGLEEAEHHDEDGVDLSAEEDEHEDGVDAETVVGLVAEELDDHVHAPPCVAEGGGERDEHECEGGRLGL
jgi:hypothetical protein